MQPTYPDITGVILAGGQSSRFGENKAFARYGGVPFIFRILKVIKHLFSESLLITNSPEFYRNLPIKVVCDDIPNLGPLGGIATALRLTSNQRIFVVACDMPLLNFDDIELIIKNSAQQDIAIAEYEGKAAYTLGVYSKGLLAAMNSFLNSGNKSVGEFCRETSNVVRVPLAGTSAININTKQDLMRLETQHAS